MTEPEIRSRHAPPATGAAYPWIVVALGSLVFMTNYTDKTVMGVVAPRLVQAMGINNLQLGVIFSAFGLTYTLLQPLLSWLTDVLGPRALVGGMVGWYGLFTIGSGLGTGNLATLTLMRAMTGAGEAASMPAATSGVARWLPEHHRGLAQGIMHGATRIGAALTVPVTVASIYAFGLTGPFWVFGLATLAIAVMWIAIYRDPLAGSRKHSVQEGGRVWHAILRSRSLWALCLADFCYFYTLTIYITWLPTFLVQDRHFSLMKVGIYGFLPFLGGGLGGLVGGEVSDYFGTKTGNHRFWRRLVPTVGMVGSVALLLPAVYSTNQVATIALFTCSFFCLDATISVFWAIAMDVGGDYASTTAGWMNTWANVGGIISPLVFGALLQSSGNWSLPFLVASTLMLIGAALVWQIDPNDRIAPATQRPDTEERQNATG
ncbi:MAG TPA: MFS transporter [Rhodopila sp.]|uniref:MFS transporter n=1 Tax=Rhodopila sp. TaxID=2480087 RepID=UPI002C7D8785|nr:MFS transporter [Rhodopila sp.]HVY13797.1 MFS transporter [Rhodopila sp.]